MSSDAARRLALHAQGFADKAPGASVDRRHLRRAMARMRVLQLDSIPVVIRTQYLALLSRLGPYPAGLLDRLAYRDDEWFEAWAHEASLLPVASEPLFRWMKARVRSGHTWKWIYEFAQREPAYVQSVLDEVRARGTVAPAELTDPRPASKKSGGWGGRSHGALALDWLFRVGELGIRRRGNFEKHFSPLVDIGEIVARLDVKTDREHGVLRIKAAHAEVGRKQTGTAARIVEAIRDLARLVEVETIEVVKSGDLAPLLRRVLG
jgi:uncharacterized protein